MTIKLLAKSRFFMSASALNSSWLTRQQVFENSAALAVREMSVIIKDYVPGENVGLVSVTVIIEEHENAKGDE